MHHPKLGQTYGLYGWKGVALVMIRSLARAEYIQIWEAPNHGPTNSEDDRKTHKIDKIILIFGLQTKSTFRTAQEIFTLVPSQSQTVPVTTCGSVVTGTLL